MAIDAKRLLKEGLFEAQGPLQSLVQDLEQIEKIYQESATRRRKMRLAAGLWLIGAVICVVLSAATDRGAYLGTLAFAGFAIALLLFICSFVYGRKVMKHNSRRDLLKKLFGVVQQDADAQSAFSVRLSLDDHPKLISEVPWPQRKNGKQQYFEESWLSLEGRLLDGAILSEQITELSRKRTFTNPRGKTKTKRRSRFLVALRFAYPKDVYGDARAAQQALHEQVRLPAPATLRGVRVSEKAIALKALTPSSSEIPRLTGMLAMGAYRILNLARRHAATGREGAK
jgi:hypothetical protein